MPERGQTSTTSWWIAPKNTTARSLSSQADNTRGRAQHGFAGQLYPHKEPRQIAGVFDASARCCSIIAARKKRARGAPH